MRHDSRKIGLLLLATASVYSGSAVAADDAANAALKSATALEAATAAAMNPGAPPAAEPAPAPLYFRKSAPAPAKPSKAAIVIPVPPVPGDAPAKPPIEVPSLARRIASAAAAATELTSATDFTSVPADVPAAIRTAAAAASEAFDSSAPLGNPQPFGDAGTAGTAPAQSPFAGAESLPGDPFAPSPAAAAPKPAAAPAVPVAAEGASAIAPEDVAYDGAAGTVEIHVNNADLVEVLRMLSLQSQKNIIASRGVDGRVTANLYNVTVKEAMDAILASTGFVYRERGNFIYVYTADELALQEAAPKAAKQTRVFRCYYTPVATAVNMIKPVMSEDGQVAFTDPARSGLDSGTGDAGGNSHATEDVMVVTDFPHVLDEVARVLKEIDKRPQQILIEATILRAALSEDNALGVDFQVLGGVDFSGLGATGATVGSATGGAIVDNAAAGSVVNKGFGGAGTAFTNNVPGGGLQVGVVKNNIAVFLEALEQVTDTTVLANPKILALNKQKGEVIVGRKDGYITTTVTQTTSVQSVEFLDTGTRLIFRPYIGDDGFIRMEIHPEDSSGGLTNGNLPFKVTTEVTSNVLVKDGHTVVIGGLFREDSSSTRAQVPLLGNIPLAGALFRSQRDRTTREEVIILLTPHIIKDEVAFSQLSEKELRRMDQMRVGIRRGMMTSGRERLAEGFYDNAVAEMAKPKPDAGRALWHLNAATNLNPKFTEAIELKQRLTSRRLGAVDNNVARDFVRKLAINDLPPARADVIPATQPVNAALPPTTMPVAGATTRPTVADVISSRPWSRGRPDAAPTAVLASPADDRRVRLKK